MNGELVGDYGPGSWGIGGEPRIWESRTGDVETATHRGGGDYPASWGPAPGSRFSEERASWVAEQVRITQVASWIRGGNARTALALVQALRESE